MKLILRLCFKNHEMAETQEITPKKIIARRFVRIVVFATKITVCVVLKVAAVRDFILKNYIIGL